MPRCPGILEPVVHGLAMQDGPFSSDAVDGHSAKGLERWVMSLLVFFLTFTGLYSLFWDVRHNGHKVKERRQEEGVRKSVAFRVSPIWA